MKKTRFLTLLALLLCACTVLSACTGPKIKPGDLYIDDLEYDVTPPMKSAQKLELEGIVGSADGDLVVLVAGGSTEKRYSVYNVRTNSTVFNWAPSDTELLKTDFTVLRVDDTYVFYFVKQTVENKLVTSTTTVIYDANGKEITSLPKETAPVVVADMMMVENRYYRLEDDAFVLKFEHSMLSAELPAFTVWNKENYYNINSNTGILVYGTNGLPKCTYSFAQEMTTAVVLNNGNVLLQYFRKLPADASNYDIYDENKGVKYDLVSMIYDVKKQDTKEIKLDYIIRQNIARDLEYGFDLSIGSFTGSSLTDRFFSYIQKKIDNIAVITAITDKRIDYNNTQMVSLSNQGNVKKVLSQTVSDQSALFAIPMVEDRYMVTTNAGMTLMINGKGEVLGDISRMEDMNLDFIIAAGRIYNTDLQYVLDTTIDGYEIACVMDHQIILKKEKAGDSSAYEYYLISKDLTTPQLINGTLEDFNEYYYVLKDADKNYIYYNDLGEEIYRGDKLLLFVTVASDDSAVFLNEGSAFYRFAK